MSNWLNFHPKVAAVIALALVLIAAGPQIKAAGIDLSAQWQLVLVALAGWAAPTGGDNAPKA